MDVERTGADIHLTLATRRSPLALAQSRGVADALTAHGHTVTLLEITTTGDRWSASGATQPADRGMFVKELEQALLEGRADLAVHSAKDLPTELPDGLAVLAVPAREDPRDVLVGATELNALPRGARVGTGSPRRRAQILAVRPDLVVVEIRGNVDTRLAKRDRGEVDAVVLAAAGLARLGITRDDAVPLPVEVCTPAPGQGVLAIEGRDGDDAARAALAPLIDPVATLALAVERDVLARLGGGCFAPVGALCAPHGAGLRLTAFHAPGADGTDGRRVWVDGGPDAPPHLDDALLRILRGEG